jgi:hypothetical protein
VRALHPTSGTEMGPLYFTVANAVTAMVIALRLRVVPVGYPEGEAAGF